ncbi:WW domain binding protein 1-like b isoform X2 [Pangasianodon hypophthalmus]|uniref:WW domain binding protein 1-like b isoform X2 n=1 Tax=Pangasianodon hypophthalmus TaxID=310915 RepID=UPI00147D3710|nr:WW domain binding protein 1-like b isoform X2 [Pangasianodon hypophthalmus]
MSCAEMGLFFYTAGTVSPTEATLDQSLQCVGENNQSYICESGHCCEDLQCCNYYYELWWFWLMCAIIFILTCCCVCRHRRVKHRLQQQQRQHEINLIAYREARNYTSPPFYFRFLPSNLLPDYEDVTNHPLTPPPPYCNLNTGPPACTNSDQEEAQCPSTQATPMPTASAALCSSPDIVGLENSRENQQRDDGKDRETILKQDMDHKDQERDVEVPEEETDGLMGRRRHFTGDSGIEVCLCSQGIESDRPKELEELLSNEGHSSPMEFCDGCGARDDKDNEQGTELDASPRLPLSPQLHPSCLYLHTIKEPEGPQECQS